MLRSAIRRLDELCKFLDLELSAAPDGYADFPLLVTRPFASRMRQRDPTDPLLLQVLPRPQEHASVGFRFDAVGDLPASRSPRLIQKYHGRVLLMAAANCAIHCRYCFRRHYPYATQPATNPALDQAVHDIAADPTLTEVILSGGDPLMLPDPTLSRLLGQLGSIAHIQRIRIHTRLPIVIPSRVTSELERALASLASRCLVVLHANHANEIDVDVTDSIQRLRQAGALVLNQSVLLRGVNDSVAALSSLSQRLLDSGVLPYYLHDLDRVAGVQHFGVARERAESLIRELRRTLPGYAVPRLVTEEQGALSKLPIG